MGYQVGNHCYLTKSDAENVYFSSISPVVKLETTSTTVTRPFPFPSTTAPVNKATLVSPEFKNGRWYLQENIISANLPSCDPMQNFKDGSQIGWLLFSIILTCWVINILRKLIR